MSFHCKQAQIKVYFFSYLNIPLILRLNPAMVVYQLGEVRQIYFLSLSAWFFLFEKGEKPS